MMKNDMKTEIRYACESDREFWFTLDRHLDFAEFQKKVRDKQAYVLFADGAPVGILRYQLFWDNTPFCTLLYVKENVQRRGFGKTLTEHWESEMRSNGYRSVLVSTRADESAQNFYRFAGYSDCGSLILPDQPTELFLRKSLPGQE